MYTKPTVTPLGTVRDLTQALNKVGAKSDIYSSNTPLTGSLVQY